MFWSFIGEECECLNGDFVVVVVGVWGVRNEKISKWGCERQQLPNKRWLFLISVLSSPMIVSIILHFYG